MLITGQPYKVHLDITSPEGGTVVANWLFAASAFTVDGKQLAKREEGGTINLPAGFHISGEVDLTPYLKESGPFKLGYASDLSDSKPVDVTILDVAPQGLDFMDPTKVPDAELSKYAVQLRTNRGDILLKLWPDVAPNTVRNFLDLSYKKADGRAFYDGTTFHRVIPGFMIQGGDPTATGSGNGPRESVKAEFSTRKHLRGVLSMARRGTQGTPGPNDPFKDTASCQFFIVQKDASASLDGNYTCFGEAVSGLDVVDKIVSSPRNLQNDKPNEPQTIQQAIVLKAVGS